MHMEYGVVLNEESYSVPVLHKYVYGVVTYSVHMFVCTASVRIPSMRGREPLTKKQPTFAGAAHSHPQRRSMAAAPLIPLHTYMYMHTQHACPKVTRSSKATGNSSVNSALLAGPLVSIQ